MSTPSEKLTDPGEAIPVPLTSAIRDFKYLALQGGGMKGPGHLGGIEVMAQYGILSQLEAVAGSSAGGFLALMLAVGCTVEELKQEMDAMDFKAFEDPVEVGVLEATRVKALLKGGAALANISGIGGGVGEFADAVVSPLEKGAKALKLIASDRLGLYEGAVLQDYLFKLVLRKTGNANMTFGELSRLAKNSSLHGIANYKELILTGTNVDTGQVQYFSAQDTPEMKIAEAARITGSFPGAFIPVIHEGQKFIDGGLRENLPDVFNKPPYLDKNSQNSSNGNRYTLAVSFEKSSKKRKKDKNNGKAFVGQIISAATSPSNVIKRYGQEQVAMIRPVIGTLNFKASEAEKDEQVAAGREALTTVLENILQKEEKLKQDNNGLEFSQLSIDALIRTQVTLIEKRERISADEIKLLSGVQQALTHRANQGLVTEDALLKLKEEAKLRLAVRLKDFSANDSSEDFFNLRLQELKASQKDIKDKLEELEWSKRSLEYVSKSILETYKYKFSVDVDFEDALNAIAENQQQINQDQILGKESNQDFLLKRDELYSKIISKYTSEKYQDTMLADFFKDLQADSQERLYFQVPTSEEALKQYCEEDIKVCGKIIENYTKRLKEDRVEEQVLISLKEKLPLAKENALLLESANNLKQGLKESVQRKTTLSTKLNNYLLKKQPKFKRAISVFSKGVAVLSFAACSPLGALVWPVAKTVFKLSENEDARKIADGVIDFFRYTNLKDQEKLAKFYQKIDSETAELLKSVRLSKKDEENYFKAVGAALRQHGGKLSDVYLRKPGEKKADYNKRLDQLSEKIKRSSRATAETEASKTPEPAVPVVAAVMPSHDNLSQVPPLENGLFKHFPKAYHKERHKKHYAEKVDTQSQNANRLNAHKVQNTPEAKAHFKKLFEDSDKPLLSTQVLIEQDKALLQDMKKVFEVDKDIPVFKECQEKLEQYRKEFETLEQDLEALSTLKKNETKNETLKSHLEKIKGDLEQVDRDYDELMPILGKGKPLQNILFVFKSMKPVLETHHQIYNQEVAKLSAKKP